MKTSRSSTSTNQQPTNLPLNIIDLCWKNKQVTLNYRIWYSSWGDLELQHCTKKITFSLEKTSETGCKWNEEERPINNVQNTHNYLLAVRCTQYELACLLAIIFNHVIIVYCSCYLLLHLTSLVAIPGEPSDTAHHAESNKCVFGALLCDILVSLLYLKTVQQ